MDVTEKYRKMIIAFCEDFNLAKESLQEFSIDELLVKNSNDINADIDLLAEFAFKIRTNQIIINEIKV